MAVHVTPRSGRDEVVGVETGSQGPEVRVRVTAPPEGGKANKAVCKLVACELSIPKSDVVVVAGVTARHKRLAVSYDSARVDAWLSQLPTIG